MWHCWSKHDIVRESISLRIGFEVTKATCYALRVLSLSLSFSVSSLPHTSHSLSLSLYQDIVPNYFSSTMPVCLPPMLLAMIMN